jgi:hypothetical protein
MADHRSLLVLAMAVIDLVQTDWSGFDASHLLSLLCFGLDALIF